MSLILRRDCQQLLNDNSMSSAHVAIDTSEKVLVIAGECGKPIVIVHGISFTRLPPTLAEIAYAKDLLEKFLVKYSAAIQKYMVAKTVFNTWDVYNKVSDDGTFTINCINNYIAFSDRKYSITWDDGLFTIIYNNKNKLYEINVRNDIEKLISLDTFKYNREKAKEAINYLDEYIFYIKEEERLRGMLAKLSQCDI